MWLALEKNFQTRSLILDYHHRKSLKGFSWNNDASIRSNIDEFMSIVMDLRALGHVITEVDEAMDLIMRLPQTTRWESVVNQLLIMLPQSKDDLATVDGADNKVTFSFELIEKRIMEEAFQTTSPLLSRPNSKFAYLSPAEANDGDGIKRSMNNNGSIQ
ncbi:hypothetical protein FRC02_004638 [Tulasnella sp. 418]|nr:hypothetical protein FRC02_004638 [Tulasnella sp. 418]